MRMNRVVLSNHHLFQLMSFHLYLFFLQIEPIQEEKSEKIKLPDFIDNSMRKLLCSHDFDKLNVLELIHIIIKFKIQSGCSTVLSQNILDLMRIKIVESSQIKQKKIEILLVLYFSDEKNASKYFNELAFQL